MSRSGGCYNDIQIENEGFQLTCGATLANEGHTSKGAIASIGTCSYSIFSTGRSEFAGSLFR